MVKEGSVRVLAIDIGSYTGWALFTGTPSDNFLVTGDIQHGMWDLYKPKFDGAGWRYLNFVSKLRALQEYGKIDVVFYEAVRRHMGTDAAHIYGGLLSHLQSFCESHEIPYRGVPIGTWKNHLTGKGNSNKQVVADTVKKLFKDIQVQDEADAIGILKYAIECELK